MKYKQFSLSSICRFLSYTRQLLIRNKQLFLISFCLLVSINLISQCTLACNNEVQVSLDTNGEAIIIPDMILSGIVSCDAEIRLLDSINGSVIFDFADEIPVNINHIGQFHCEVRDIDSGNTCWGRLIIENKFSHCEDIVLFNIQQDLDTVGVLKFDWYVQDFEDVKFFEITLLDWFLERRLLNFESHPNAPIQSEIIYHDDQGILIESGLSITLDSSQILHSIPDGDIAFSLIFALDGFENYTNFLYDQNGNSDYGYLMTWQTNDLSKCLVFNNDIIVDLQHAVISGTINYDLDNDCVSDIDQLPMSNWLLEFNDGQNTYYTNTDDSGNYQIHLPGGTYTINAVSPNDDIWAICENGFISPLLESNASHTQNFLVTAIKSCPLLSVQISNNRIRRCFTSNYYYIHYSNAGSLTAIDAYIEIDLGSNQIFQRTDFSDYDLNGSIIKYNLNDLPINACGDIELVLKADCSVMLGETLCVSAEIFPNQQCAIDSSNWSGATIEVKAECIGEFVEFRISNTGIGNMLATNNFIVIEDHVMRPPAPFSLGSGESQTINLPANGSTYRLLVEQAANHPHISNPTAALETCGLNADGEVSLGFINTLPEDDAEFHIDIHCAEVIGSYDPNDKTAWPKGYGAENYIYANTDLEYLIRFQNTGTDTAFKVVITDSLSENLDLTSFKPGVSSHNYTWGIENQRTLVFTFDDIGLVDSFTNEELSNGFIKFRIKQIEDLEDDVEIRNEANIYFDFNEPILTNEVLHTIGSDFIPFEDWDLDQDGFLSLEDCDDNNSAINPGQAENPYNGIDDDCNPATLDDDLDQDGFVLAEDCDDSNAGSNPDQIEIPYNGIDEDCNPLTLDDDFDQDGFILVEDCDDENETINPAQTEIPYNGIDEDCNPMTLDDDLDQDGFVLDEDCNDTNAAINPDQTEVPYNGIDEDCNQSTLDDDFDQDGFNQAEDCNDNNPLINPEAEELCDNLDNNCNEAIDEGLDVITYYIDLDQDGYGDDNTAREECSQPDDMITTGGDCDDNDATINPDAEDIPNNGIDENCDGEDMVSSLHDINHSNIKIFPNPFDEKLTISVEEFDQYNVQIFDIQGKLIKTLRNPHIISGNDLDTGMYIIKITSDSQIIAITRVAVSR